MQAKKIADLRGHEAAVYALAQGTAPEKILTAGGDGWIVEWDFVRSPDLGRLVARADAGLFSLLFLPQKNLAVTGDLGGGVRWIDLEKPDTQKNIAHHRKGVYDIQLIDNQVVTLGGDGILTRWDVEKRVARESFQPSSKSLRCAVFLKKKGWLAIGASDGAIHFLDFETFEKKGKIERAHEPSVFALAVSADEKTLFSGGRDARLKTWNLEKETENGFEKMADLPAHNFAVNSIALDSEAGILVTASRDRTIKIWDCATLELLKVIEMHRSSGHFRSVNRLLFAEKRNEKEPKNLISASDDRTGAVWEISR